ncbi:uncharacterized protein LOC110882253 [Helianthus annuus]|uniref:uncharacterized protein LOC110882253 n=1 Tax=Helianthus annuus TaxID=4232 RepID=UPI000B8F763C|nr:uncharacterized protein LOC110882253 [Helianthus annuus]
MSGELINVVNVYAQNDAVERRGLWVDLLEVKMSMDGLWLFLGDFNDVWVPEERINSEFIALNANFFNQFIADAELLKYQMGGRKFTYHSDNGIKCSKLDRALVCINFMTKWPMASLLALSNEVSDHCPILLTTMSVDFGPKPTRVFNSWLEIPGLMDYEDQICSEFTFTGRADLGLATKLKWLKLHMKKRVANYKVANEGVYAEKLMKLEALDFEAENRSLLPHELELRADCKAFIFEADKAKLMDLRQKSRVR